MKKDLLFVIVTCTAFHLSAQNLVSNASFEQNVGCPSTFGQINLAVPWINATTQGSPDYLHQCALDSGYSVPGNVFGYEPAHSGEGYSGITLYDEFSEFREYIEMPLASPLDSGICYYFEMYVNLGETYSMFTTDDIGVYFSDTLISTNTAGPLLFVPQLVNTPGNYPDTSGWTLVSGTYTATGGESYLIIGNYLDYVNTTAVPVNNSALSPGTYAFIDDVVLISCLLTTVNENPGNTLCKVYPNPFTTSTTILIYDVRFTMYDFELYDLMGRTMMLKKIRNRKSEINNPNLQSGIYFYKVTGNKGQEKEVIGTGKLIIE